MERSGSLPGVSVVVPVHGHASFIPEMVRRLRAGLPDRELEIVMVDDASPDDSLAVMRGQPVVVVAHSERRGQNGAILAGLAAATQPFACVLDADLQDPPEGLAPMLARLLEGGASVVFSSREAPWRASSRLFRWTIRRLYPWLPETPCLCFALDREARLAVVAATKPGDYLVAVIGALRLPTASVRVVRERRRSGGTTYPGLARLRYASAMLLASLRLRLFPPRER